MPAHKNRDQDCTLSAGVQFQNVFAPNYRITIVVRQPQIHGLSLGLALNGFILVQFVKKIVLTNFLQAEFEIRSLRPQVGVLPTEQPVLVQMTIVRKISSDQKINRFLCFAGKLPFEQYEDICETQSISNGSFINNGSQI